MKDASSAIVRQSERSQERFDIEIGKHPCEYDLPLSLSLSLVTRKKN